MCDLRREAAAARDQLEDEIEIEEGRAGWSQVCRETKGREGGVGVEDKRGAKRRGWDVILRDRTMPRYTV